MKICGGVPCVPTEKEETGDPSYGGTTKRMRKQMGMTLEKMADKVGIRKSYISSIENGKVPPPSVRVIRKVAKVLNANERELIKLAYVDKAPEIIREEVKRILNAS